MGKRIIIGGVMEKGIGNDGLWIKIIRKMKGKKKLGKNDERIKISWKR